MESKRRLGRLLAVKSLYPERIGAAPPLEAFKNLIEQEEYPEESLEFAKRLVEKVSEHLNEIDELVKGVIKNWQWDRVSAMDKAILGIAVVEFLYFPENPPKVVINEAIEIANEYSTEKSGIFINGLLDRIAREKGFL
ncbi:transcription antitermination factor NusB [candidate division WOR-3 bacterium]|nr:transcription antitermination factor NusB [candidate division WOR-3 bacterium]MCK4527142.1 transcription antitermination factor NusB [candidate division WOR-3 bacterium]